MDIAYRQLVQSEYEGIKEIDASQFIKRAWREINGVRQLVEINWQDYDFSNGYETHLAALKGTFDKAKEILNWLISCYAKNDAPLVYPILLNDGQNIGYVQAVPITDGWEIGYHVAKSATGNGYATEAVHAFLNPIMNRLGIKHIYGICRADNAASRKVLEKCGFALESDKIGSYQGEQHRVCRYRFTK